MELTEILNKIEAIIKEESKDPDRNEKNQEPLPKPSKRVQDLILLYFLKIVKNPSLLFPKALIKNLFKIAKKDAKLYAMIMGIMMMLFVFFAVIWLSISIAVGFYFFEKGHTLFTSVLYSVVFQLISFCLLVLIAFLGSKRIKSLSIMKDLAIPRKFDKRL